VFLEIDLPALADQAHIRLARLQLETRSQRHDQERQDTAVPRAHHPYGKTNGYFGIMSS